MENKLMYKGMLLLILVRVITITLSGSLLPILVCLTNMPAIVIPISYGISITIILYLIFFTKILNKDISLIKIVIILLACGLLKLYIFSIDDLRLIAIMSEPMRYIDAFFLILIFVVTLIKYLKQRHE